ncbi:hypothetical protein Tco_1298905 [Tanacetum coccineum]
MGGRSTLYCQGEELVLLGIKLVLLLIKELASPKQTTLELAIPGQTETGKESSNLFMAGSLLKTIHFYDSLQSDEDKFKNPSSDNEESLGEDASKHGRIDDANVEVTFIDKTSNDARNKNNKSSNSKRWKMTKKQL